MSRTIPTQNPKSRTACLPAEQKPRANNPYNCLTYEERKQLTEHNKQVIYKTNRFTLHKK